MNGLEPNYKRLSPAESSAVARETKRHLDLQRRITPRQSMGYGFDLGSSVNVDGRRASISGIKAGKIRVKFEDGTERTVDREDVQLEGTEPQGSREQRLSDAIKKARGRNS